MYRSIIMCQYSPISEVDHEAEVVTSAGITKQEVPPAPQEPARNSPALKENLRSGELKYLVVDMTNCLVIINECVMWY